MVRLFVSLRPFSETFKGRIRKHTFMFSPVSSCVKSKLGITSMFGELDKGSSVDIGNCCSVIGGRITWGVEEGLF